MKIKLIGYSATLLLFFAGYFLTFFHPTAPKEPQNQIQPPTQKDTLIAPAIIDSLSDITRVPTLQSGIIKHIHVTLGQKVKKGDPLVSLDSVTVENNLHINKLVYAQTKHGILIQQKQLKHLQKQLARLQSLDKRAVSQAELHEKLHEVNMAMAHLTQAQYSLELSRANVKNAKLTLEQFTTVAPKDGVILQINAHVGEFVGGAQQLVFLGDANKIIVRVSLDERDNHYFSTTAAAYLTSQENTSLKIPLTFIQLDRYIITQERLNSRVQEALYSFNREKYPNLVAGQLFDAIISLNAAS